MPLSRLWREISHGHLCSDAWEHTGLVVAGPAHVLPVTAPHVYCIQMPGLVRALEGCPATRGDKNVSRDESATRKGMTPR